MFQSFQFELRHRSIKVCLTSEHTYRIKRRRNAAGDFLCRLPVPPPESEANVLVASAECKGVLLVTEDLSRVAGQCGFDAQPGQGPGNRRCQRLET
jgi:hypothetical protein